MRQCKDWSTRQQEFLPAHVAGTKTIVLQSVTGHSITVVYTIKGIFNKGEMHIAINIANEN